MKEDTYATYGTMDHIQNWRVIHPKKDKDHVSYTVIGQDLQGKNFEIERRYSEFFQLRELFKDRWPGLYIPPIPIKKKIGSKSQEFLSERCF